MPPYIRTVATGLVALLVVAMPQSQPMKANIGMQSPLDDELGHTRVRVQQLYKGVRVWGGGAVDHVGAAGEVREGQFDDIDARLFLGQMLVSLDRFEETLTAVRPLSAPAAH